MLVLSRKLSEAIVIDGRITITVVNVGRGRVQLGVTAPREMSVYRQEVAERVSRERRSRVTSPCAAHAALEDDDLETAFAAPLVSPEFRTQTARFEELPLAKQVELLCAVR